MTVAKLTEIVYFFDDASPQNQWTDSINERIQLKKRLNTGLRSEGFKIRSQDKWHNVGFRNNQLDPVYQS